MGAQLRACGGWRQTEVYGLRHRVAASNKADVLGVGGTITTGKGGASDIRTGEDTIAIHPLLGVSSADLDDHPLRE